MNGSIQEPYLTYSSYKMKMGYAIVSVTHFHFVPGAGIEPARAVRPTGF